MICYSREGSPKPDRNPIILLSTVASNGEEKQFTAGEDKDDKPVIKAFIEYIRSFDPDVIVSYGANTTDWNYLLQRSHSTVFFWILTEPLLSPTPACMGMFQPPASSTLT